VAFFGGDFGVILGHNGAMSLKRALRIGLYLLPIVLSSTVLCDSTDLKPLSPPISIELRNVKIQWFARGAEELPAWINAHFVVGPLGIVSAMVTETNLGADGVDEDGDPGGFETTVFDTRNTSLSGVRWSERGFTFTTIYPDKDAGRVDYAVHRSTSLQGGWVVRAAAKSAKGLSFGRNRFPLVGDQAKDGLLKIHGVGDALNAPLPTL